MRLEKVSIKVRTGALLPSGPQMVLMVMPIKYEECQNCNVLHSKNLRQCILLRYTVEKTLLEARPRKKTLAFLLLQLLTIWDIYQERQFRSHCFNTATHNTFPLATYLQNALSRACRRMRYSDWVVLQSAQAVHRAARFSLQFTQRHCILANTLKAGAWLICIA